MGLSFKEGIMKRLIISFLCILSLEAKAVYITTGVAGLDIPQDPTEDVIVIATSGDVLWASSRDVALITKLKAAIKNQQLVELEVDKRSSILRAKLLPKRTKPSQPKGFAPKSIFQANCRGQSDSQLKRIVTNSQLAFQSQNNKAIWREDLRIKELPHVSLPHPHGYRLFVGHHF